MMNPRRLLIQGEDKRKVNLKIKAKVRKKLRPLIFQRKKVMVGIVGIVIKMIMLMIKLHPKLCPYKHKNKEKTNVMVIICDDIEGSLDVDERVNYSIIQKVEESQDIEEKMIQSFHLKIQIKKTKIDCIVDSGSQANLILETMVSNLGLETFNHPNSYPLGWVHHNASLQVTKQYKLKFAIYANAPADSSICMPLAA